MTRSRIRGGMRNRVVPLEKLAQDVIEHHSNYWRGIFINLAAYMFMASLPVVGMWLAQASITSFVKLPPFRFDLSSGSALAAFGILATLIVALQVSVRTPMGDDRAAAAARQIGLETLARLCGASAFAIGLAAVFGQAPWSTSDPIRYFGPIAGAFLLGTFAGDAASASSARLGQAIAENKRVTSARQRVASLEALESRSATVRLRGYAVQVLISLVVAPCLASAVFLALWGPSFWSIFPACVLFVAVFVILGTSCLVAAQGFWLRSAFFASIYCGALALLCACTVFELAFVVQPGAWPSDFRDVFWRSVVAAVTTVIWAAVCISLSLRIPFSSYRGLGNAIFVRALRWEIDRQTKARRVWSARDVFLVLLSVCLPPAGIVYAYHRNQRDGSTSSAPLWVGYVVLAASALTVVVLLTVNPAFA